MIDTIINRDELIHIDNYCIITCQKVSLLKFILIAICICIFSILNLFFVIFQIENKIELYRVQNLKNTFFSSQRRFL